MAIHGSLFEDFRETESRDQFTRQNSKLLKIRMDYGPVNARLGSMVAYQATCGSPTAAPAAWTSC
ncbi:hypothetical protein [Ornithinimicrobium sp. CNJ-824]|uniref:hypothetical protein n=1 Tax=Ornithinimicrobium sp. CNJ-824 TaxID=1904966 RepID=UPI001EDBFFE6|nr:hypothetical protein [Ornithinimicrobium sp. CNJ-824]